MQRWTNRPPETGAAAEREPNAPQLSPAPSLVNPPLPDLVLDTKIETTFAGTEGLSLSTRHVRVGLGSSSRARQLRTEETWRRLRLLGGGAYGTVWLEERVERGGDVDGGVAAVPRQLRAVKEIRKPWQQSGRRGAEDAAPSKEAAFLWRELEAIAKFSQERVSSSPEPSNEQK